MQRWSALYFDTDQSTGGYPSIDRYTYAPPHHDTCADLAASRGSIIPRLLAHRRLAHLDS